MLFALYILTSMSRVYTDGNPVRNELHSWELLYDC